MDECETVTEECIPQGKKIVTKPILSNGTSNSFIEKVLTKSTFQFTGLA